VALQTIITLNGDPLPEAKTPLDMRARHKRMAFPFFERTQYGETLVPSPIVLIEWSNPATVHRYAPNLLAKSAAKLASAKHHRITEPLTSYLGLPRRGLMPC
jgi:hypothetical protein